jgi:hypothetical protein
MNTIIVAAIRCSFMFLFPAVTHAISAQWDLDPVSGDWNTAANWTPMEVPNGPADNATFGLSKTTDVSISANTEVDAIVFSSAATNPYIIGATDFTVTISGVGIEPANFRISSTEFSTTACCNGRLSTKRTTPS